MSCAAAKFSAGVPQHDVVDGAGDGVEIELEAARGRVAQIVASLLALVATLAGGGVAVWHTWLTMFPPASFSCGRPFEWFHDDFLLAVWLPKLFRGAGDCLHQNWTLLGLSIPQWSVLVFAALLALLVAALWRAGRAR